MMYLTGKLSNTDYIVKHGKLFILLETCVWFLIGALIAYAMRWIPSSNQGIFYIDAIALGSLSALIFGFLGSLLYILKI